MEKYAPDTDFQLNHDLPLKRETEIVKTWSRTRFRLSLNTFLSVKVEMGIHSGGHNDVFLANIIPSY